MACVDIVKDTREDITRFMFDSYIWRSVCVCVFVCVCVGGGGCLEAVAQYPANM